MDLASDVLATTFKPELLELPKNEHWGFRQADQGVLLLNLSLTRDENTLHTDTWKPFIDYIIDYLNKKEKLTWIVYTKDFPYDVNDNHLVLRLGKPAKDMLGNRPFSRVNEYLEKHDIEPINW